MIPIRKILGDDVFRDEFLSSYLSLMADIQGMTGIPFLTGPGWLSELLVSIPGGRYPSRQYPEIPSWIRSYLTGQMIPCFLRIGFLRTSIQVTDQPRESCILSRKYIP